MRRLGRRLGFATIALIVALVAGKKEVLREKLAAFVPGLSIPGMEGPGPSSAGGGPRLPALRKALRTTIGEGERDDTVAPEPPAGVLEKVQYPAPLGNNVAYVTPVRPGPRGPAIVWIVGGFNWGIDAGLWQEAPRENDQTAAAFRKAGIAQMFPALRGANQNPGHRECFLGEVDDVLAAADFLAKRPDVDPQRIYLGGHSTGGTLALLAAESTDRFRAVFSFGPVGDARQYGQGGCLPAKASLDEVRPRAPVNFISEITSPTLVIEGAAEGNSAVFAYLERHVGQAPVRFIKVPGGTHFTVLGPGCEVIAEAILIDTGEKPTLDITADAIARAMQEPSAAE
jgi:acetyl esterase/lipase